ncbi:hypothetical protein H2248_002113 [Termitomyces sp. 'cryptogamus']|nr:hypothetical protein H2248_002113 [Termitomyces sp. 'cryptogamus']
MLTKHEFGYNSPSLGIYRYIWCGATSVGNGSNLYIQHHEMNNRTLKHMFHPNTRRSMVLISMPLLLWEVTGSPRLSFDAALVAFGDIIAYFWRTLFLLGRIGANSK